MLGKCANPVCPALFRKLGSGKLFAFETKTSSKSAEMTPATSGAKRSRNPVFFWLCDTCSSTFNFEVDAAGQLTLRRAPDGPSQTIFDGRSA